MRLALNNALDRLHAIGWTQPETELVTLTDEPKTPAYVCVPKSRSEAALPRWDTSGIVGHAMDLDENLARTRAVAECVERLSLRNPLEASLVRDAPTSSRCDPTLFRPYSSAQLDSLDRYLEEVRSGSYRWCPALDLRSGEATHVPAQMVFLSSEFDDEPRIRGESISTGAALGPLGSGHALASGIFEAVERDSTISAYLTRRPVARIVDLPAEVLELVDYLDRYCLEPHIFDFTGDLGIPTVVVVMLDRSGLGPAVHLGSAASGNYRRALVKALLESVQTRRAVRLRRTLEPSREVSEDEVISSEARYNYWWPHERIRDLDFWLETAREVSYRALTRREVSAEEATSAIISRGYHLFVADVTHPEVHAQGFEVLKVLIPELHTLYINERHKFLYSARHGEIADDTTLKPHPFV